MRLESKLLPAIKRCMHLIDAPESDWLLKAFANFSKVTVRTLHKAITK